MNRALDIDLDSELSELEAEREQLHSYIVKKLANRDYHAVADAAMDLRELEVRVEILEAQFDA